MQELQNNTASTTRYKQLRPILDGVSFGAAYGLFLRFLATNERFASWIHRIGFENERFVITIGFLCLGPLVMGLLNIHRIESYMRSSVWQQIFSPWASVILMMAVVAIVNMEGTICIVMAFPIALFLSSIGGLIAGLLSRRKKFSKTTTLCVAMLPLIVAPLEASLRLPDQTREVKSHILIHANPETVWRNIERVPAISSNEIKTTWTQRIGFPKPIEATLSYKGIGGVRHASFERGLVFIETITTWQPEKRLAFTIKADTANIPSATLDEHVTIGGRYFDVLNGEYEIEPLSTGDVLLHLTSHQRLTTDLNSYAGLWTSAVMQSIQNSILEVIQHRCESGIN